MFPWKLSALDVPDPAAAWYLVTVRAEATEAAPRMMATTKMLKNVFILMQIWWRCGIKINDFKILVAMLPAFDGTDLIHMHLCHWQK